MGATGSDSMCSVSLCSRIWDTASGQCLKTLIGECCWCPLQGTGLCPRRGCLARLPPSLRSTASAPSARAPLPAAPSWCPGPPSSEGRGPLRLRPWLAEPRAPLSALLQPGVQPPPRGAQSGRGGAWRTGSAASACGTGVGGALGTRWGGRFWARAQWSREPALREWGAAGPAGPGCCCRGGLPVPGDSRARPQPPARLGAMCGEGAGPPRRCRPQASFRGHRGSTCGCRSPRPLTTPQAGSSNIWPRSHAPGAWAPAPRCGLLVGVLGPSHGCSWVRPAVQITSSCAGGSPTGAGPPAGPRCTSVTLVGALSP